MAPCGVIALRLILGFGTCSVQFLLTSAHARPKYFVMENVATIRNTDSFRKVNEHFPAAGYGLTKMILDVSVLLFYDFFQK